VKLFLDSALAGDVFTMKKRGRGVKGVAAMWQIGVNLTYENN
jgi:hypothetical protein